MAKRVNSNENFSATRRLVAILILIILATIGIATRLVILQVVEADEYKQIAASQHNSDQELAATRGEIWAVSSNQTGAQPTLLASSINQPLVFATPGKITQPDQLAEKLSAILGVPAGELLPKLKLADKKYVPLKRQITEEQKQAILALSEPGLGIDTELGRIYPEGQALAQVLGFVGYKGDERVGRYGLEQYFEDVLGGRPGYVASPGERGRTGSQIFQPPIDGSRIDLTIDLSVQRQAEDVIKRAVEANQADSGSIAVMDPTTGAMIAMATFPTFNVNDFRNVPDGKVYNNQVVTGAYEPGSIFKPLTMAAALNEKVVAPDSTYTDTGRIEVDGFTIRNSDNRVLGQQTMTDVLAESLNTGVVYAKEKIGNKKFLDYMERFGFGKLTGIELPESPGSLQNLTTGNIQVNYDTASFGQGISVTPIQMLQAFGALANRGEMMRPYIVSQITDPYGRVKTTKPQNLASVITPAAAAQVTEMLQAVVERGHGKKAGVPGYFVAGKTGTAQVPKEKGGGYEENNNIGSFIGYAPADNPKFVMLVRVNHPRTVKYAETTAAPAFGELAGFMLRYYGIPTSRPVK